MTKNKRYNKGMSKNKIYQLWAGIRERCANKKIKYYGGKGVKVCKLWDNDFLEFNKWAVANGWKIGLQIDRIDSNGNYEPTNCRFVTHKENNRNRSSNRLINYAEESKCMTEWAELYNMSVHALYRRLKDGWSIEAALTKPIKHKLNRQTK